MPQYDLWLDLECIIGGVQTVVCTLFTKRDFPVRPIIGENITFWSAKESRVNFKVINVPGIQTLHYVPTEIDDLAHHFHPNDGGVSANTCVRCRPVQVATIADARLVVDFLSSQHGFALDPYGSNKLDGTDNAA